MITPLPTLANTLDVAACLSGVGVVLGHEAYAILWSQELLDRSLPIHQLEMLNLFLAIRQWEDRLRSKVIQVRCDNIASVCVVQSGRGQDKVLLECARHIWAITARSNIVVQVEHVPGEENELADALSRQHLGSHFQERVKA